MRIEEGKFYRAANGEKIGPMTRWEETAGDHIMQWEVSNGSPGMDRLWRKDGTSDYNPALVALWSDGPTRTVTRQEIVPGTYDGVSVQPLPGRNVRVSLEDVYNSDGLTRAAAVLTALAGALRDGE